MSVHKTFHPIRSSRLAAIGNIYIYIYAFRFYYIDYYFFSPNYLHLKIKIDLKSVIGRLLICFCVRACTLWFTMILKCINHDIRNHV